MAWVQILSRVHLASLCRGSSPRQDPLTCFFGKEKILRTSLGSCVKPVFVWRQSRWSVLDYLERLPADSLFLKEGFDYSIFAGFSLSHQTHWVFSGALLLESSIGAQRCSVPFLFGSWRWILLLEPGSHHLWHSRSWSVPSKGRCFSTETHRLLLRSQGPWNLGKGFKNLWVFPSKSGSWLCWWRQADTVFALMKISSALEG